MLYEIKLPDLTAFEQPPWNTPQSVGSAFAAILEAQDEASSLAAHHRLLYAVGNNHAGTYYSAVLAILPGIEDVLRFGHAWSQRAALEVLADLCGSFEPERGQELYEGTSLQLLLKQRSLKLGPLVGVLTLTKSPAAESAKELFKVLCSCKQ